MSSDEFTLHQAYWSIEPSGPEGIVQMWAALMAAIYNGALIKHDKSRFRADEFWPANVWAPQVPEEQKPGQKRMLAPDFSHLRGMRVKQRRK